MNLPKYLFIEPQAAMVGSGIILCTQPPYIYAKVHKYKTKDEQLFNRVAAQFKDYAFKQLPGYLIGFSFFGTLNQSKLPSETIFNALHEIANFYLTEKINNSENTHYNRFTSPQN